MKKINKLLAPILSGVVLISPVISLTSCGETKEQIVDNLVKSTVKEFKELGKHPRASTMLKEIQMYLMNWCWIHGYLPMMDNAGNIWFDVPATKGKENYPRMILQGHMDMVFKYDIDQTGEGKKDIPDPKTWSIELEEKEIQDQGKTRKVIQSKDQFTSIGADDGIGIAMILAIITDNNVSHGPLRCVFTVDEEEGLVGAKALSRTVFEDCNYILNFDGEGKPDREDIICNGCSGFCEYQFKHEFNCDTATKLPNSFTITISGLRGQHYMDETYIAYKEDGNHAPANADRMMLEILNAIPNDKSFQIQSFVHHNSKGEEVDVEARQLPNNATVVFYTDYTDQLQTMKELIENTINDAYKQQYKEELWDKVTVEINKTDVSKQSDSFLSASDSRTLTSMWGKTIECGILDWEGETHEEKIAHNYPAKSCNVSSFKVAKNEDKMMFSIGARGMANTVSNLENARDNFLNPWKAHGWDEKEIKTIKYYHPWDTTDYHSLIDFTADAYKKIGIEPSIEKTRGGVEPAFFAVAKPGIEQVVIGPRIDNIHTPKETLFVDSIPAPMAVALYVIENINLLNK